MVENNIENLHFLPGMIDTHFHYIEMIKKGMEPDRLIKKIFQKGLVAAIDIATSTGNFEKRLDFAQKQQGVYITVGISPSKAENKKTDIEIMLAALEKQIQVGLEKGLLVAIGETGIDLYWNYGTPEKQLMLFERQIELADKYSLPVIIHNRDADKELLEVLKRKKPTKGGIIHCFSSDYHTASACIDYGFLISFAGNITYKKSNNIQDAAKRIPATSILCETDSPYLSPQELRKLDNNPEFVSYIYDFISQLREVELPEFVETVKTNFTSLFNVALT